MFTPPPMRVRVAMRHVAKVVPDSVVEANPHYVRLHIKVDLPSGDRYLQKIVSTAARASDSVPFIRRTEPVEVTLDLPIALGQRKAVEKAVRSLPFVRSVVIGSGPPIR